MNEMLKGYKKIDEKKCILTSLKLKREKRSTIDVFKGLGKVVTIEMVL